MDSTNVRAWPPVSVIMPVLDKERHLTAAVTPVLDQDYPGDLELVVALGPSQDRTGEVAAALAEREPRPTVDNPAGRTPNGLNAATPHGTTSWPGSTDTASCRRAMSDARSRSSNRPGRPSSAAGPVGLAAAGPLDNLRPLVLGDRALELHQQRVLRRVRVRPLDEHHAAAGLGELLDQQRLVGVLAGQPVRGVDEHHIHRHLGHQVPQPLQRRRTSVAPECPSSQNTHW
jgi:glycosyltransferase involved in cell wall biosynthesis